MKCAQMLGLRVNGFNTTRFYRHPTRSNGPGLQQHQLRWGHPHQAASSSTQQFHDHERTSSSAPGKLMNSRVQPKGFPFCSQKPKSHGQISQVVRILTSNRSRKMVNGHPKIHSETCNTYFNFLELLSVNAS